MFSRKSRNSNKKSGLAQSGQLAFQTAHPGHFQPAAKRMRQVRRLDIEMEESTLYWLEVATLDGLDAEVARLDQIGPDHTFWGVAYDMKTCQICSKCAISSRRDLFVASWRWQRWMVWTPRWPDWARPAQKFVLKFALFLENISYSIFFYIVFIFFIFFIFYT